MENRARRTSAFVIRPTASIAMVYVGLCAIWFLWILVVTKHPTNESAEPFRLISTTQYLCVTAINVALTIALVFGALQSRHSPPGLRRGHLAGAAISLVTLAFVQAGAFYAHGPIAPQ